jgi:hypothetical protein
MIVWLNATHGAGKMRSRKSIWRVAGVTVTLLVGLSACSSTVEDAGGAPPKERERPSITQFFTRLIRTTQPHLPSCFPPRAPQL